MAARQPSSSPTPYRDATEGLAARARELESALVELGSPARPARVGDDAVERLRVLEGQIDDAERDLGRRGVRRRWIAGTTLLGLCACGIIVLAGPELRRLEIYAALPRNVPAPTEALDGRRMVWRGTIVGTSVRSARIGGACTLVADVVPEAPGVVSTSVRLSCAGIETLSTEPVHTCRVNELPAGSDAAAHAYRLACDVSHGPVHLSIDTPARRAHVADPRRGWVEIFLPALSAPHRGEALFPGPLPPGTLAFAHPVERTGRVERTLGRAPVQEGERCTVSVLPVASHAYVDCRVLVTCGSFRPFGDARGEAGYQTCSVRGGQPVRAVDGHTGMPWAGVTLRNLEDDADGDPMLMLDLDRGTVRVAQDVGEHGGEYVVDIALD